MASLLCSPEEVLSSLLGLLGNNPDNVAERSLKFSKSLMTREDKHNA